MGDPTNRPARLDPRREDRAGRPIYLLIELDVRDREAMTRYAAKAQPLVERYGGRIVGMSITGGEVIEGDSRPRVLSVHRWPARSDFDAFYESHEYQPL